MSLAPGSRLGAYEVIALLGAGGMGEVFRARDTRLNRDVALKILPDSFLSDADRIARFQREARVLASLNHTNIAHIYGLEESGSQRALVLELVEGPTLADRIAKGPLSVEEATAIARQLADALEAAHEHGIIHRDLKPANIKLTADGQVKVLDFGLARPADGGAARFQDLSASPTITSPAMTMGGVILGTAAYMSPEQAKGKAVDKRTDIWAFGCVLFEMLTGGRAFEAEDVSETLAAVLRGEPDWATLRSVPASVVEVVKRCLEKDRKRRIADIADVRYELERPPVVAPAVNPNFPSGRSIYRTIAWLGAGLVIGTALSVAVLRYFAAAPPPAAAVRFTFSPPAGWEIWRPSTAIGQSSMAVSPDGTRIAFVAHQPGQQGRRGMIWIRSLDHLDPRMLVGTDGATSPFWSPDGRSLGFFADGKLKRIEVEGGPATTLADAPNERGGSWSPAGVIVFAPQQGQGLERIAVTGGQTTPASVAQKSGPGHARPWFLPDGRHFVYRATVSGRVARTVYLGSVDTLDHLQLMESESSEHIYSQGHLLFLRGGTLMAQRLESSDWSVTGQPYPLVEGIASDGNTNMFAASPGGVIAYQPGATVLETALTWLDRGGKPLNVLGKKGDYNDLELSPDGKQLGVTMGNPSESDIWIYDVVRGVADKVTSDTPAEFPIVWSADSRTILFSSPLRGGFRSMYAKDLQSVDGPKKLGPDDAISFPLSAARDGSLLFQMQRPGGPPDLWWLPASGDRQAFRVMQTQYGEVRAKLSPDERWIAYASDRTGAMEVWVTSFPKPGQVFRISTAGGTFPRWRRDGRELFYLDPGDQVMALNVDGTTAEFKAGEVKALFKFQRRSPRSSYDVSSDGQKFIVAESGQEQSQEPIVVISNWASGLLN